MNGPGTTFSFEVNAVNLIGLMAITEEKVAALIDGAEYEANVLVFEIREWTGDGYFANVVVVLTEPQAATPEPQS